MSIKRSPNYWSLGDDVAVPSKVVHYEGGGIESIPAQVGKIASVSPLKVRVDLCVNDTRDHYVEAEYGWDELEIPNE